jgi:CheY-like chemotaxis protein
MKKHSFLVEDDRDDMLFFMEILEQLPNSNKCTWAQSGEQALQQLMYLSPDVIVLDFSLPGMNGLECLEAIRSSRRLQDVPVVIYSSGVTKEIRHKALALGASAVLEKAVSIQEVSGILTLLLGSITETATT